MHIPETPITAEELNLLALLDSYAKGERKWLPETQEVGDLAKTACRELHTDLLRLINTLWNPILEQTTSREMEMFTMHDPTHARKVAHLMWNIMEPARRARLTPPEIGILVASAYMHDMGMALSSVERAKRLAPDSDIWEKLSVSNIQTAIIVDLQNKSKDNNASEEDRRSARHKLQQAEEALLCMDIRTRHCTKEGYRAMVDEQVSFHKNSPTSIANVTTALAFQGDSFLDAVINVCETHGQGPEVIAQRVPGHPERPLFRDNLPIGSATADLQMCAAALRLADILDFDRERTPAVLFNFLLPSHLGDEHYSVLEWKKHLAISNWDIGVESIVFRGRCTDFKVHHSIVEFCKVISKEIETTKSILVGATHIGWPFILPIKAIPDIDEIGYNYLPYQFELEDQKVYELLMGNAIYDNPLDAVRELVQNAVDACLLRDSLTKLHDSNISLATDNRIFIRYVEPENDLSQPKLIVEDTGTGMDKLILEKYFLKVGNSFYSSSEFAEMRASFRGTDLDFAPISEFGIGFLSSFLIADHLTVETAMWEPQHGEDTMKRILSIDGPTRLIRLSENENTGSDRFKGTKITLLLTKGGHLERSQPPHWFEIVDFLKQVCLTVPYTLHLERIKSNKIIAEDRIENMSLEIELPPYLESSSVRIRVDDQQSGLIGHIAILNSDEVVQSETEMASYQPTSIIDRDSKEPLPSNLIRGGFRVGEAVGLPNSLYNTKIVRANLALSWAKTSGLKYQTPHIGRGSMANPHDISKNVTRIWLSYLLEHVETLSDGIMHPFWSYFDDEMQQYGWLAEFDASSIYKLGKNGWAKALGKEGRTLISAWESGTGDPIRFWPFSNKYYIQLLEMVLPQISTIEVRPRGYYYIKLLGNGSIKSVADYEPIVKSGKHRWGIWVEYVGEIDDLLMTTYPDGKQLNLIYRDLVESQFEGDDLDQLVFLLVKLIQTRTNQGWKVAKLNANQSTLLAKAVDTLGHLEVGSLYGRWPLNSFSTSRTVSPNSP